MKNNILLVIILFLIFSIGFYLRTIALPDNMLFGYEQGRDAIVTRDILQNHKFTLLGPQTDIPGIYHGVGYYYWLTFVYLITHGDPGKAIFIFAGMNALTCIIVFFLAKELTGKTRYAILASLMIAFSFDIIIYGRWLSNVSLSVPFIALFFYALTKLVKTKNPNYWLLVGFLSGSLAHFELLHLLFAVVTSFIAINLFALPVKNKQFLLGICLLFLANISFILFDIRHDFLVTNSVLHYLTSQSLSSNPLSTVSMYIDGLITTLVNGLFPSNGTLIFIFIIILLFSYLTGKRENLQSFKLIILMIFFSVPYIFLLKFGSMEHFYAGTAIAWILLFNFLISKSEKVIPKYLIIGIYGFLLIGNFIYIQRHLVDRYNIFYHAVQKNYIYKDQLETMNYIFLHEGINSTITSFTIPYYHEQAWNYLYNWYGKTKYPNEYAQKSDSQTNEKTFVIIEPGTQGKVLDYWLNLKITDHTTLLNTTQIGEITIQERKNLSPIKN